MPCISPVLLVAARPWPWPPCPRLAKRPRSGLALTRRTRPRQSCREEDGAVQSGEWPVGSDFTDGLASRLPIYADQLKHTKPNPEIVRPSHEYPAARLTEPVGRHRATAARERPRSSLAVEAAVVDRATNDWHSWRWLRQWLPNCATTFAGPVMPSDCRRWAAGLSRPPTATSIGVVLAGDDGLLSVPSPWLDATIAMA